MLEKEKALLGLSGVSVLAGLRVLWGGERMIKIFFQFISFASFKKSDLFCANMMRAEMSPMTGRLDTLQTSCLLFGGGRGLQEVKNTSVSLEASPRSL